MKSRALFNISLSQLQEWKTILVEEQYSVNVSEHYINFNSTHHVHWLDFDLKVFSSIYLAYQLHSIFYL